LAKSHHWKKKEKEKKRKEKKRKERLLWRESL